MLLPRQNAQVTNLLSQPCTMLPIAGRDNSKRSLHLNRLNQATLIACQSTPLTIEFWKRAASSSRRPLLPASVVNSTTHSACWYFSGAVVPEGIRPAIASMHGMGRGKPGQLERSEGAEAR